MRYFRPWFSRRGGVGQMVGLDDLRGLFQPVILWSWLALRSAGRLWRALPSRWRGWCFACGWVTRFFSELAVCLKRTGRSSPWLFLNIVLDLHGGVEVHRRLTAYGFCNLKELCLVSACLSNYRVLAFFGKWKSVVGGFPSLRALVCLCNLTAS